MFLSIIVTAHNEQARLPKTLESINTYLETKSFLAEVIIIDNASSDNTFTIASDFAKQSPKFRVIQEFTRGKGAAVRTGMLNAKGDWRFMCDADLSMPIDEIDKFIPNKFEGDIAIASRELPDSKRIDEPTKRHISGRIFNFFTRTLLLPQIHDTQCGFKCFRGEVAEKLFRTQTINGWAFDVEILTLARLQNHDIFEVPITLIYYGSSNINLLKDSIDMARQIFGIYIKYKILRRSNLSK